MRVVFLSKVPEPGRVKTRTLLPPEQAAGLHQAMAEDCRAMLSSRSLLPVWSLDGSLEHPWVDSLRARGDRIFAQQGEDLGQRIQHALSRLGGRALALGTDAPTLPAELLQQALKDQADVVLGPALDGGCWTIGWARPCPGWLEGGPPLPWSSERICQALIQRARTLDLKVSLLPYWYDVDTPSDLEWMRCHLSLLGPERAPHTRRHLQQHSERPCP